MKRLLLVVLILLGVGLSYGQRVKPSSYSSYVNLVEQNKGSVIVRSIGWGKSEASALQDAEVRAILTLLYVGLPQAQHLQAMIGNEQEANDANPTYFERLIDQQAYKRFVVNSAPSGSWSKMKGEKTKSMPVDITINVDALKKDLESNKIVRKFGF